MNGSELKIEIFKPFGEAWELMLAILFRPFDFSKWLVIGFAAFLSGHFAAGGFSFPTNLHPNARSENVVSPMFEQWKPWMAVAIAISVVIFLILFVVLTWIKARGNFVFTDCVVRNRAAIVQPWREYRREGNNYFLFLLVLVFCSLIVFGLLVVLILVPLGIFGQGRGSNEIMPLFVTSFALLFGLWVCLAAFLAVVTYFMVPVMYRQRCGAVEAFRQVASLAAHHAGPFILFCLFGLCLLLAMLVIGGIATCFTCCLAALPYLGTVILLPVFVCLRAFGLCFLRQFGPEYDVWAAVSETPPSLPPAIQ